MGKQQQPMLSQPDKNTAREEQKEQIKDRLAAFAEMDDNEMEEGTSTYHKFAVEGETFIGRFVGTDFRVFDKERFPDKQTECAVLDDVTGARHLFAQTIIVNELKKKWDETKEVGFPVKIIYTGMAKAGTPDQYQSFRLLFERKK